MNNYHYLFKYIIIGDTNVGKSSILLQSIHQRFNPEYEATIGVEFGSKTFAISGKEIKLQIWDTAGQESFKSITRSYYRGSIGAVLVFDITNKVSFENIGKWIEETKLYGNEKLVCVLVGNKSDLNAKRQVTYDEAILLAKEKDMEYIESSAKMNHNTDKIFSDLTARILLKIKGGEIDPLKEMNSGIKIGKTTFKGENTPEITFETEDDKPVKKKCGGCKF